mgnify:CR=1 FL=1
MEIDPWLQILTCKNKSKEKNENENAIVHCCEQQIITKEYQKGSKNSVSAKVVAFLAVVTLIKDCYKI